MRRSSWIVEKSIRRMFKLFTEFLLSFLDSGMVELPVYAPKSLVVKLWARRTPAWKRGNGRFTHAEGVSWSAKSFERLRPTVTTGRQGRTIDCGVWRAFALFGRGAPQMENRDFGCAPHHHSRIALALLGIKLRGWLL